MENIKNTNELDENWLTDLKKELSKMCEKFEISDTMTEIDRQGCLCNNAMWSVTTSPITMKPYGIALLGLNEKFSRSGVLMAQYKLFDKYKTF